MSLPVNLLSAVGEYQHLGALLAGRGGVGLHHGDHGREPSLTGGRDCGLEDRQAQGQTPLLRLEVPSTFSAPVATMQSEVTAFPLLRTVTSLKVYTPM